MSLDTAQPEARQLRELYVPSHATGIEDTELALTRIALGHIGGRHRIRELAKTAWFRENVHSVVLSGFALDTELVGAVAKSGLLELQLISSRCRLEGAMAIESAKLEILSLRDAKLGVGDVAKLLRAKLWPSLTALDLRSNSLGPSDVAAIATLPKLRVLNLANTRLDGKSAQLLATLPLRRLDLRTNLLRTKDRAELAAVFPHSKRTI